MDFSKLNLNGNEYNVKDEKARKDINNLYVSNINELKQSTTLKSGDVVKTLGYYVENDGGSGLYLIREKIETDVEDNGLIHFIGESLVAELIVEDEVINILQFGAKNDDSDDCTDIFNKAISSKYNNIFIPQGQYRVNGTITMKSNLYLEGCGTTSNINISNIAQFRTTNMTNYTNINFYNLTFRVNGERTSYAIDFINSDLCKIEKCIIRSDNGTQAYNGLAFRLTDGEHCYDNKVINCQFQRASLHFTNSTDNFIINNLLWADEMETGALVLEGGCHNTLISGNHFGGHPTLGCLRMNTTCYQLRIVDNYFDAKGIGINAEDIVEGTINNNLFFHSAQAMLINNLKMSTINNNIFRDCDLDDEGYSDINITNLQGGNTFMGNKHYRTDNRVHTNKSSAYNLPNADTNYPETVISLASVWFTSYYNAQDLTNARNHFVNCYPNSLFN